MGCRNRRGNAVRNLFARADAPHTNRDLVHRSRRTTALRAMATRTSGTVLPKRVEETDP